YLSLLFAIFSISSTSLFAQIKPSDVDEALWRKALEIQKKAIVIDGHNDITSPMVDMDFNLAEDSTGRYHSGDTPFHTDLNRMKASGMTGQFMSIYVSGRGQGMMRRAMDMIDATYRETERHKDLEICTTAAEIRIAKKSDKICMLMGIEGG